MKHFFRITYLALVALLGLTGAIALGNYAVTVGSGTNFGSVIVGGVHYAQQFICDLTTPGQCATVSAAGAVKVDGSAVTQPVSGTVTANVGTGTRPISIASAQVASGAYASGAFASGSFSSGAFASGSYASGAFATGSMVDLLTVIGTKNAGTASSNSLTAGGVYNSTPLTLTNTQQSSLQLDANGYLKVNTAAGAAAGGTSSNFGSAFPTPGTAIGFTDGTNMVAGRVGAVANVAAATNFLNSLGICNYNATPLTVTDTRYQSIQCDVNGFLKVNVTNTNANGQAAASSSSPVVVAKNSGTGSTVAGAAIGTAGTASAEVVTVQGVASMTPVQVSQATASNLNAAVVGTGTAGSAAGGVLTVQGVASMTPVANNITQVLGSAISATNGLFTNILQGNAALSATNGLYFNNLQGNAVLSITNPTFNRPVATATGGASTTGNIAANNTTAVVVKGSAGTLYGAQLYGIGSAPAYLKIYNATSATCGSGTPVKRLMIPAASTAANGAGSNISFGDVGIDFSTGITYCVTTGIGDSDTTAPAASTFLVNLDWK